MKKDMNERPLGVLIKKVWLVQNKVYDIVGKINQYNENRITVPDELLKEYNDLITARIEEIKEAINRYTEANLSIRPEWIEEYNELIALK